MFEFKLKDLHKHAYLLSRFFFLDDLCQNRGGDWTHVGEWLNMAAGVVDVDIDSARYDPSVVYCSGAARYEAQTSDYLSLFARELTTFSFVWGSLEAAHDILVVTLFGIDNS